ncbi:MAG: hypothetical protein PHN75_17890 [Syntrophales bacterium]|nr:hypothetical protein [Syntrophales bacterium]
MKGRQKSNRSVLEENANRFEMPLTESVKKLKPGDVVIKGANALDYKNRLAGVNIGDQASGTTGITMPYGVFIHQYSP